MVSKIAILEIIEFVSCKRISNFVIFAEWQI